MNMLREFGEIIISNCSIGVKSTIEIVRHDFEGTIVKEEVVNGWISFYLEKVMILGQEFSARLMFSPPGKLAFIFLALTIDGKQPKWENWNEKTEQIRNERQNQFLEKLAGNPPYDFEWGEIVSDISVQSGNASITIRYK